MATLLAPNASTDTEIARFLRGEAIYGDDFSIDQIAAWYDDEREGYSGLVAAEAREYKYYYHALNELCGYRHLPQGKIGKALGVGSAFGDEFRPIASRLSHVTLLEPSQQMQRPDVFGVPAKWVAPEPSGDMPFESDHFDLVNCLAVLHHVPNVTHVLREAARVLKPGGYLVTHEPVTSQGDWRSPRHGLTKHERGIPRRLFLGALEDADLEIVRCSEISFRPLVVLLAKFGVEFYNSRWATRADLALSRFFLWNQKYHDRSFLRRFAPVSVYVVARKPLTSH